MTVHAIRGIVIPTKAAMPWVVGVLSTVLIVLAATASNARADIIESGDLNIIRMTGNASDGLAYLDLTFSDGRTKSDALANARAT